MKRILVTGGSGFIGSHTCYELLKENYELFILDSLVNSSYKSLERVKEIFKKRNVDINSKINFFKGDLRDKKFLDTVFQRSEDEGKSIEGVIHFAGLKSVAESVINPVKYWENNVLGSINLIQKMAEYNCKTIVFSSSATVYGNSSHNLISESAEISPINPYGATKLTIENFLRDISQEPSNEWRIAILRYFNPIGAHSSGLIGENPLQKPNNIFPIIINAAYENENLKVFGNDWETSDGTCIRDYIHVMDLAEGHLKALEFLLQSKSNLVTLNLGTGIGISVLELIKTFERVNNVNVPFNFDKRRDGDVCRLVADNLKSREILKWSPKKSIEEMCNSGWHWKCLNPKGY